MSDRPRLVARLEVIPHTAQRYDTCGDWQQVGLTTALIRASDLGNRDYEFLVLLHELVEWYLCSRRGITEAAVDAFDKAWEAREGVEEPGDDPAAPYHLEHVVAGLVERVVAHELGIEWADYEAAFDRLPRWQPPMQPVWTGSGPPPAVPEPVAKLVTCDTVLTQHGRSHLCIRRVRHDGPHRCECGQEVPVGESMSRSCEKCEKNERQITELKAEVVRLTHLEDSMWQLRRLRKSIANTRTWR